MVLQPLLVMGLGFVLFLAGSEELAGRGFGGVRGVVKGCLLLALGSLLVYIYSERFMGLPPGSAVLYALALGMVSLGPAFKLAMHMSSLPVEALNAALVAELGGILLFNIHAEGLTLYSIVGSVLAFALVYSLGRGFMERLLLAVEEHIHAPEAPFAIMVAIILGASYAAEVLGFNAAIAALLLGLFASGYLERRPALHERLSAFTYGFMEPLFFSGIGLAAARPGPEAVIHVAGLLAVLLASRLIVAGGRLGEAAVLMAKGGVDASLLYTALSLGLLPAASYTVGVVVVAASTLTAGLLIRRVSPAQPGAARGRVERWRARIGDLPLDFHAVSYMAPLSIAAELLAGREALVVVDEHLRPIGYITPADLIHIDPASMRRLRVADVFRLGVMVVLASERISSIVDKISHEPVIAVVDEKGRLLGTITPRKLLQWLMGGAKG